MAGIRYVMFPGDREVLQLVGGWAVFNFVLVGAALQCIHEKQQRRGSPRVDIHEPADVALAGHPERLLRADVADASITGVRLVLPASKEVLPGQIVEGAPIAFRPLLEDAPSLSHPIKGTVCWSQRNGNAIEIGVKMTEDQPWIVAETVGHMIYGKSERWDAIRQGYFKEMGLISGMAYMLKLSARGMVLTAQALIAEPARRRRMAQGASPTADMAPDAAVHVTAFDGYQDPCSRNPSCPSSNSAGAGRRG